MVSVGSASTRPTRSSGTPSDFASGDAATPAAHSTVEAGMCSSPACTPSLPHLDAQPRHRRMSSDPERLRKRPEQVGAAFEQQNARRLRTDAPKVVTQRVPGDLRERAPELDAGRPATDDHERQQPPLRGWIGFALRRLEGEEHAAPHLERIVQRLQAGRALGPLGVPEVRVRSARCDDQVVIRLDIAAIERHRPRSNVDLERVGEQDLDVPLPAQNPSDGRRHIGRRQRGGGDLIQ